MPLLPKALSGKVAFATFILLLSSCTLQPTSDLPPVSWQEHVSQISQLHHWQLRGKLGFKAPDQGGSASVTWQQQGSQYQLNLRGPFGASAAQITGDNYQATLDLRNQTYHETPEQLAFQLTGLPIPVDALSWWVRGIPSPREEAAQMIIAMPSGVSAGFSQSGWQLSFTNYEPTNAGSLPRKINGKFGEYSFKLIVSHWQFLAKE